MDQNCNMLRKSDAAKMDKRKKGTFKYDTPKNEGFVKTELRRLFEKSPCANHDTEQYKSNTGNPRTSPNLENYASYVENLAAEVHESSPKGVGSHNDKTANKLPVFLSAELGIPAPAACESHEENYENTSNYHGNDLNQQITNQSVEHQLSKEFTDDQKMTSPEKMPLENKGLCKRFLELLKKRNPFKMSNFTGSKSTSKQAGQETLTKEQENQTNLFSCSNNDNNACILTMGKQTTSTTDHHQTYTDYDRCTSDWESCYAPYISTSAIFKCSDDSARRYPIVEPDLKPGFLNVSSNLARVKYLDLNHLQTTIHGNLARYETLEAPNEQDATATKCTRCTNKRKNPQKPVGGKKMKPTRKKSAGRREGAEIQVVVPPPLDKKECSAALNRWQDEMLSKNENPKLGFIQDYHWSYRLAFAYFNLQEARLGCQTHTIVY
ncbi:uncharacterized protein LOC143468250 [Clavelina lepadiformis]|uniref:uncharacterized protein LOC143468250 n=1 Tax=Clavelina lepadiformis TaxID=159417 RepID=UPI0040422699